MGEGERERWTLGKWVGVGAVGLGIRERWEASVDDAGWLARCVHFNCLDFMMDRGTEERRDGHVEIFFFFYFFF